MPHPVHPVHPVRAKPPRPVDPERRFDGAIPMAWRLAATLPDPAVRRANLMFWRQETREAVAQLRLWRGGADRRRQAVSPAVAALRERTLERRVAAAWARYRAARNLG
jgi:hypothetical protein